MATNTETKPRPSKRVSKKAAADPTPTPARKRAASKRAAAKPEPVEEAPKKGRRRGRGDYAADQERRDAVVELRDEKGMGWADIAEEVGVTAGMATFLYNCVKWGTDLHGTATPEIIAQERDENNVSWSEIEAKYWITRGEAWDLYAEAGGDHFKSDIGRGGRYVERDPEVVAARQAERAEARKASKPAGTRRGRKPTFKGFTDETTDDEIINLVDNRTITWTKVRGDGEDSAHVRQDSADLKTSRGKRVLTFIDSKGGKSRTVIANSITAVK